MIVGMHFSIAGRLYNAVERAQELGCNALQMFAQNPRAWRAKPLPPEEVATFRSLVAKYEIEEVIVHTPYLVNLASRQAGLRRLSRDAVERSLSRADLIGARFVVTHIGSARGQSRQEAIETVARSLKEILSRSHQARLLLENTAGAGQTIGDRFEEIARIIEASGVGDRLLLCFDTAHAYAAGYDVATAEGLEATLQQIDRHLGIERLKVVHTNDTKVLLGSHVDRHYHIGLGRIGREGFRRIVNHTRLRHLPFILETPVDDRCDDRCNLRTIRSLVQEDDGGRTGPNSR